MTVAIIGGALAAWVIVVALVKHDNGWVGVSDIGRIIIRYRVMMCRVSDAFAAALPTMRRANKAMGDLVAALEREEPF